MSAEHFGDAIMCADAADLDFCGALSAPLLAAAAAPRRALSRGQGFVEYALIILFVAIAVVAGLTLLGPTISSIFNQLPPAL